MKHSHIDPGSEPTDSQDEGFLTRWSRRKHEAGKVDDPQDDAQAQALQQREADAQAELTARREAINQLTDDDMPPLESLNESSDYSVFMSEKVSETLRRQALRQMFKLPGYGVLDGLNDYDEDYTYFEPLGDIVTSDMRFHAEREAAEKAEKAEKERALQRESSPETAPADSEDDMLVEAEDDPALEPDEPSEPQFDSELDALPDGYSEVAESNQTDRDELDPSAENRRDNCDHSQ